jgi:3-hydroxymyristoyl/3-hydroxydecanoyl-(acyl carrier protein) dehydratase
MVTLLGKQMPLKSQDLIKIMPHGFSMIMLDKITKLQPGKYGEAIKNVTVNERYFRGHFPSNPIMPGVWELETMYQLAYLVELASLSEEEQNLYFTKRAFKLVKAKDIKFRQMVTPGDSLQIFVDKINREQSTVYKCCVVSDNKRASEAILTLEKVPFEESGFKISSKVGEVK